MCYAQQMPVEHSVCVWPVVVCVSTMGQDETNPNCDGNQCVQVGLDRPHASKACVCVCVASTCVECAREAKGVARSRLGVCV